MIYITIIDIKYEADIFIIITWIIVIFIKELFYIFIFALSKNMQNFPTHTDISM